MPIKEAKGKAAPRVTKTPINGEGGRQIFTVVVKTVGPVIKI